LKLLSAKEHINTDRRRLVKWFDGFDHHFLHSQTEDTKLDR